VVPTRAPNVRLGVGEPQSLGVPPCAALCRLHGLSKVVDFAGVEKPTVGSFAGEPRVPTWRWCPCARQRPSRGVIHNSGYDGPGRARSLCGWVEEGPSPRTVRDERPCRIWWAACTVTKPVNGDGSAYRERSRHVEEQTLVTKASSCTASESLAQLPLTATHDEGSLSPFTSASVRTGPRALSS